jgi:hypothetical protein
MTNVLGWVPTGVDCDYFQPPTQEGDPLTLIFLGSMDGHAKIDAVHSFVTATYPLIKRSEPKARLLLIGRNPSPAIRELANQDASIEVSGTVDDRQGSRNREVDCCGSFSPFRLTKDHVVYRSIDRCHHHASDKRSVVRLLEAVFQQLRRQVDEA